MKHETIARVAHAINIGYAASLGELFLPTWEEAGEAHQKSLLAGVDMHLANPDTTPDQSHAAWLETKVAEGWTYGEVKDVEKKQHPCILPYDQLPPEQRSKDHLFRAIVHALKDIPDEPAAPAEKPSIAAVVAAVSTDGQVLVPVKYIGRKPAWSDRVYGSGLSFVADQVRNIPPHLAEQFLRHRDIFEEAGTAVAEEAPAAPVDDTAKKLEEAEKKQQAQRDETNALLDLKDQVTRMADKDSVQQFALEKYRQKLPKTLSIENMREKAHQLIDQFGAV